VHLKKIEKTIREQWKLYCEAWISEDKNVTVENTEAHNINCIFKRNRNIGTYMSLIQSDDFDQMATLIMEV